MVESRKRARDEDEDIEWETRSLNHKVSTLAYEAYHGEINS